MRFRGYQQNAAGAKKAINPLLCNHVAAPNKPVPGSSVGFGAVFGETGGYICRKIVETGARFWYYQTYSIEEHLKNRVKGKRRFYMKEAYYV